ncbi:N-acetylmuramoyl-L-alanine amidase [Chelativorans sp. AA-79]|uniref:N-acetylmuramoyl-L-alanine amidase n=1 Tax=Chelativorans sp. AA-79 TaxID=3028735 RepID=UPI0023F9FA16|nr:N-acetylmuramoyl-L-alanine amidase [Chelativorans sp. AA-79]WEX07083.1 N-acetylmuramoyl-L-alanine amidase [Chelativorans sp. AA-79]
MPTTLHMGREGAKRQKAGQRGSVSTVIGSLFLVLLSFLTLLPDSAFAQPAQPLVAYDYLAAGDQNRTRIVLNFDREPKVDWFLLRTPHRLVIDLPETEFGIEEEQTKAQGLVSRVRYGRMAPDHSRMIFTMPGPFAVEDLSVLKNETSPGYRLIVDIVSTSETAFEAAMRERITAVPDAGTAKEAVQRNPEDDRFTVAIDAGHGGIDSGARGVSGTLEKAITLTFARELKKKLEETGKYSVVLTRDEDVFLRLDERVRIARENGADLLISIHADAIALRNFRGATVYTLSERASDAEAAATAARENLSDEIAGLTVREEQDEVADILVDLIRRETHAFSIHFARTLLGELDDTVHLVGSPLRSAGFIVLKAPDVPSVLVELGYLSNAEDEKQMKDPAWRAAAIDSIIKAIAAFAAAKAGG